MTKTSDTIGWPEFRLLTFVMTASFLSGIAVFHVPNSRPHYSEVDGAHEIAVRFYSQQYICAPEEK